MSGKCHLLLAYKWYRKMQREGHGKSQVEGNDNMVTVGWVLIRSGNELGKSDSGSN